jgi:hypothetical protein
MCFIKMKRGGKQERMNCQVWQWCTPVISALRRLSQEDAEFQTNPGSCLKNKTKQNNDNKKNERNTLQKSRGVPGSRNS